MDLEELKDALKAHLKLKMETRCGGHMAPIQEWLIVMFDDQPIAEVMVSQEVFD
jgi:hypothetical protein